MLLLLLYAREIQVVINKIKVEIQYKRQSATVRLRAILWAVQCITVNSLTKGTIRVATSASYNTIWLLHKECDTILSPSLGNVS